MNKEQKIVQIDIEKIIRNQPNKTIKKLPGFIIKFIQWLVMEKEMNWILKEYGHLKNFEFIRAVLDDLNVKIEIINKENIPDNPNFIMVGNHALGGHDFFAVAEAMRLKHNIFYHLTNEILLNLDPIKELMLPVNVFGHNSSKYKELYNKKLGDSSKPISIFPSGEVARTYKGEWNDGLWRSGFIRFAKKYNRIVVPFFIPTRNSPWFYRIGKWRKKLGVKANIELFLLPRQIFYQRRKTVKIIIGKPILPETFDDSKNIHNWSAEVKKIAYELT